MTQTQRILDYCKTHDGVTTLEASDRLRVCRLSERIRELEAKGYTFSHTPEHTENGARVIRYRLMVAAPQVVHSLPTPSLVGSPAGAASYKQFTRSQS